MLSKGVTIMSDHRKLAYVFSSTGLVAELPTTTHNGCCTGGTLGAVPE